MTETNPSNDDMTAAKEFIKRHVPDISRLDDLDVFGQSFVFGFQKIVEHKTKTGTIDDLLHIWEELEKVTDKPDMLMNVGRNVLRPAIETREQSFCLSIITHPIFLPILQKPENTKRISDVAEDAVKDGKKEIVLALSRNFEIDRPEVAFCAIVAGRITLALEISAIHGHEKMLDDLNKMKRPDYSGANINPRVKRLLGSQDDVIKLISLIQNERLTEKHKEDPTPQKQRSGL